MTLPRMTRRKAALLGSALLVFALAAGGWAWRAQTSANAADKDAPPHTNRLVDETSPYLLQHAHNPVDWYAWGEEAFKKAQDEDKPIFLSIGYSSCHWCHVMERESFEDQGIADLLNAGFVAVKVDREERPDIDEIYMTAVQMMTGSGGWPMTTFLTPDGKPFFGGTYFPRDQLAELLRAGRDMWADPARRKEAEALAARVAVAIGEVTASLPQAGSVTPASVHTAVAAMASDFDPVNGGFGQAPKFPPAMRLAALLAEHQRQPNDELREAVVLTLDRMARGGMYDQVGGGFHRYSTDEKWLAPHFEKMLYDNALLASVYLAAYRDLGDEYYRRIGTETLDFVLRELHDEQGGFWSTLDADSVNARGEEEEGAFYTWTPAEVIGVLGKQDGELFNQVYDITARGNFEGRGIPNLIDKTVAERAKEQRTTPDALWQRLDAMRAKLLAAREARKRPPLDDKVLANWNGLMIRALALGYDLTGEARYRRAAEAGADFALTTLRRKDGRLMHSYRQGKTQAVVFLEDYSYAIVGLLELHSATGDARWLDAAQSLAETMVADFWDEKSGAFFFTPHGHEKLLARSADAADGATPNGQAMAALGLVRLARLTGDASLRGKARSLLDLHATGTRRYPRGMATMLLAAQEQFSSATRARVANATVSVIVGDPIPTARRAPGMVVPLALRVQPGWHINSHQPSEAIYTPTTIELAPGPFELARAEYPAGQRVTLGFSQQPLSVYAGEVTVRLDIRYLDGYEDAGVIRFRVRYQACNDEICEQPVETLISVPLK